MLTWGVVPGCPGVEEEEEHWSNPVKRDRRSVNNQSSESTPGT